MHINISLQIGLYAENEENFTLILLFLDANMWRLRLNTKILQFVLTKLVSGNT